MNKFQIGDNVILKHNRSRGVVTKIVGINKVKIIDEDNFEYTIYLSEIIPINIENDNRSSYGEKIIIKDILNSKPQMIVNQKNTSKTISKIIDLHIEKIYPDYKIAKDVDILQIQVDYFVNCLNNRINSNLPYVDIIHGIGEGKLREKIHEILDSYELKYYEQTDGGSTKVML
ncbi:MAG: hypothetical protein CMP51_04600 [Flavobacteriales bacterium]|nr:hypothetical protein [Flavobacteriales bacterium]|tara:strand:+ start:209 stop:727 length:519 start_codon:yes stop_codon:yes gene_type:complete